NRLKTHRAECCPGSAKIWSAMSHRGGRIIWNSLKTSKISIVINVLTNCLCASSLQYSWLARAGPSHHVPGDADIFQSAVWKTRTAPQLPGLPADGAGRWGPPCPPPGGARIRL